MTAPKRIQLRRTKGWRKPEGARCWVLSPDDTANHPEEGM